MKVFLLPTGNFFESSYCFLLYLAFHINQEARFPNLLTRLFVMINRASFDTHGSGVLLPNQEVKVEEYYLAVFQQLFHAQNTLSLIKLDI